jgi:hypothetical protein
MNRLKSQILKEFESTRFKLGTSEAVNLFINYWAYLHTGLYPLSSRDQNNLSKEIEFTFKKLSSLILELSVIHGEHDPFGWIITSFTNAASNHAFYPTPKSVSKLLSNLLGTNSNQPFKKNYFYEPCAGTGSIVLYELEKIYLENIAKENPLAGTEFFCEDIDPIACKVLFLQLQFKLQHLQIAYGKRATPDRFTIVCIDVLSRKLNSIAYYMECPDLFTENSAVA